MLSQGWKQKEDCQILDGKALCDDCDFLVDKLCKCCSEEDKPKGETPNDGSGQET